MGLRISKLASIALGALVALALIAGPSGAATIVTSFNPQLGPLVAIAWDPVYGNVYVYADADEMINEYTSSGAAVPRDQRQGPGIPRPGVASDDFDLDFALTDVNIGGKTVPANSLLVGNGDDSPPTIYGIDKTTGSVLGAVAVQGTSTGGVVGMAHHPARGTVFLLDWVTQEVIEVDPATGSILNRLPVHPSGARTYSEEDFSIFYGDVDVHPTTGNLFVVGTRHDVIRELSPTGQWIGDVDVSTLNIPAGMSGLAFDGNGDAWISTRDGTVYKLGNIVSSSSQAPPPECDDANAICTGDEDDEIEGTSSADFIYSGNGDDLVSAGAGDDTVEAWSGNDGVAAGPGADHVLGGKGNDKIYGDATAVPGYPRYAAAEDAGDLLEGGDGNDKIFGEAGDDTMKGGPGTDVIKAGIGLNILNGGPGRDTCIGTRKDKFRNCEIVKKRNF